MLNFEKILPKALLLLLDQTPQNPIYHAEGSVLAHTKMVAEKVGELSPLFNLSQVDLQILEWAALLHDVGKTRTTVMQGGRWRSPGHEKAGVSIARDILIQNNIPVDLRQSILNLVRWHGFPLRFLRFNWPVQELNSLTTISDLRLLSIFATMDFHGRISEDFDATLKVIDAFRNIHAPKAEYEIGTYNALQKAWATWPMNFKNAAWNAVKMKKPELIAKLLSEKPEDPSTPPQKNIVYLTIGAPFSGKTHWLKENRPDAYVVQLSDYGIIESRMKDEFFISRKTVEMRHQLVIFLRHYKEVYLEGWNLDPKMRDKIATAVRDTGAELRYLIFEERIEILQERNRNSNTPMAENELTKLHSMHGIIHPWEAHQIEWAG